MRIKIFEQKGEESMKIKVAKVLSLLTLLVFVITLTGCKPEVGPNEQTTTTTTEDYTDLSFRDAKGNNGMVASASAHASKIGLDVLENGGNAFEAAVAISFALGVAEPNGSGMGGGGYLVGYDAQKGELVAYDYREFVGGAGTIQQYNSNEELDYGIKSIGVPMMVDGMLTVFENHGSGELTLEDLLSPSIELAENGFEIDKTLANVISDSWGKLSLYSDISYPIYTSDGFSPLQVGDVLKNPDLANTMRKIVEQGKDVFYTGEIAQAIVDTIQDGGGYITMEDMARGKDLTRKLTPVMGTYKGYDIISMPPTSSGGTTVIEMLNLLEVYSNTVQEVSELEHNSLEYLHLLATLQQIAYGDKRQYIFDPAFVPVPIAGLTSKSYAAERFELYDPNQAVVLRDAGRGWGNPRAHQSGDDLTYPLEAAYDENVDEHHSTTHYTVVDKYGNIVSSTHTINYFFGSGTFVEGTGMVLNNQLSGFSVRPTSNSRVEPYKKPLSHMTPTIVMKDGNPFAAVGSPGSMRIVGTVMQTIVNLIDFEMDIQEAINANRIYCYAANSPEESSGLKLIHVESGISEEIRTSLEEMGYEVEVHGSEETENRSLYFGGVQGITFDSETGELHGGADPRRDGKALGY